MTRKNIKNKETYFSKLLREYNLTIKEFSKLTGTPYRTVQNWKLGLSRTPQIAIKYLENLKKTYQKK